MYLYLIRHGETEWNNLGRIQGRIDTPLNERGKEQALRLALRLADEQIDYIYTSPLQRALGTAEIIGRHLRRTPVPDERLIERDPGKVEGMTLSEIKDQFPTVYRDWKNDSESIVLPGAEDQLSFYARAAGFIESIRAQHPEDRIAVVTHGGTLAMFFAVILGLDITKRFAFRFDNTSISRVDYSRPRPRVDLMNDTCHLRLALPEWQAPLPSSTPAALETE